MASVFDQIFRLVSLAQNRQLNTFSALLDRDSWWQYHQQIIIENWYFYYGLHNLFLRRFEAEDTKDFTARVQDATIENHVKPIIDLITSHLYKTPDSIKRYVLRSKKPDNELNEFFEQNVWSYCDISDLDDEKALNALITGYTVLQRLFLDYRTGLPFTLGESALEKVKYGYIHKDPLDSAFCIPMPYIDESGIVNTRKFGAIIYIADHDNYVGSDTVMSLLKRQYIQQKVIEFVDDKIWLKFVKQPDEKEWRQITVNPGTGFENRNQFGRIDIPFSIYKNTGDPFYVEGESEVKDIKSLNKELNELGNGDKDTIRYHQYPILQGLAGAKLPVEFKRTKNTVIEVEGKDARFEYLTWEGKLDASDRRQEAVRRSMSHVTGISLISRGFLKEIGQIRSGPPLKALFTSDRAVMSRKFKKFRKAEILDMRADVAFYEFHTGKKYNIDKTVSFHADFSDDFLGIDKLLEAEIESLQVGAGTEDLETILREKHPDWSDEKIKESMDLIKEVHGKDQRKQIMKSSDRKGIEQES